MANADGTGKWCLGHDTAGHAESLRYGHYVENYLVEHCFTTHAARGKGLAPQLESRCNLCRSIRNWHNNHANAEERARRWRKQHAERWVTKGRHSTIEAAYQEMDVGGVTEQALTAKLLAALGKPCPALCAHEELVNGQPTIIFHTIDTVKDMQLDVMDPSAPFSIENIQVLDSCNQSKLDTRWPVFIYRRHAELRSWQQAIDNAAYRRSPAPRLPGFD